MLDIFDFVLTPYIHDMVCEAIEYRKEEKIMEDYNEFKEHIEILLNDSLENGSIKNGLELIEVAKELHDILEGVIQDWANNNNMFDDYIDWI